MEMAAATGLMSGSPSSVLAVGTHVHQGLLLEMGCPIPWVGSSQTFQRYTLLAAVFTREAKVRASPSVPPSLIQKGSSHTVKSGPHTWFQGRSYMMIP
jgi:hypothetical protein